MMQQKFETANWSPHHCTEGTLLFIQNKDPISEKLGVQLLIDPVFEIFITLAKKEVSVIYHIYFLTVTHMHQSRHLIMGDTIDSLK